MKKLLILASAILLLLSVELAGRTIYVPDQYSTIQAGIDAAALRDTVMVLPGTYTGDGNRDLSFNGKLILLRTSGGPEQTIIDCQADSLNKHLAFYFSSGEDSTAEVKGFTITHAYSDMRGAITCEGAAPSIRDCIFIHNGQSGLRIYNGFGMIIHSCVFTQNGQHGAELNYCRVRAYESSFDNNNGDGISAWNNTSLDLLNCQMNNNVGRGLTHVAFTTGVHVRNCIFVGNETGMLLDGDFPKGGPAGAFAGPDTSTIINSIFAFNSKYGFHLAYFSCGAKIYCNDWYGNPSGNFHVQSACPFDTNGIISADPLFCGTPGNEYAIANQSPCAPANNSCGVLMGRYPPNCDITYLCGDVNGDATVDISDPVYLLHYIFAGGPEPVSLTAADVNCDGSLDIADVVYDIIYIFSGGAAPCANCD